MIIYCVDCCLYLCFFRTQFGESLHNTGADKEIDVLVCVSCNGRGVGSAVGLVHRAPWVQLPLRAKIISGFSTVTLPSLCPAVGAIRNRH